MTTAEKQAASSQTNGADAPKPDNVVAALQAVMRDLPAIGKDQQAAREQGGYAYRGIESITREASQLFGKYGILFVPKVLSHEVVDITVNNKPWTDTRLEVMYTVYGPGGRDDHIEVGPIVAIGRDNSDKGANKCMTQAFKYALLQTLCIADKNDDADQGSHEADAGSRPRRQRASNANDTPLEPPEGRRTSANNTRRGPRVLEGWNSADEQRAAHDAFTALMKQLDEAQTEEMKSWRDDRADFEWPMPFARLEEYRTQAKLLLGECPICDTALTDDNQWDPEKLACGQCAVL